MNSTNLTGGGTTGALKPYLWPTLVVALLGAHTLLLCGAYVVSARLIPAATVAPAGYAEAMAWDDLKRARAESEQLGWSLEVVAGPEVGVRGDRRIDFSLLDRDGRPFAGAELAVALYHHSRPGEVVRPTVRPNDNGQGYHAIVRMRQTGLWRLNAQATHDKSRFLVESDLWLAETQEHQDR